MGEPRRAFVIGHPIAHSRSPLIHGYWLERSGIAGSYDRIDVHPDQLTDFVRSLPVSGFAGGNVTIPHKERTLLLVDRHDAAAQAIGAVNTLWLEDGGIVGGNTDAAGFAADLDQRAADWRDAGAALVLGAGGAARAILFALREAGIPDIRLVNRTFARAEELAARFGPAVRALPWDTLRRQAAGARLVVNTTALGLGGGSEPPPLDVALLPGDATVVDIVYVPLATPLLAAAAARGLRTVDGLGMLLHQAAPGFERWFGVRPAVTAELRARIIADIEGHA